MTWYQAKGMDKTSVAVNKEHARDGFPGEETKKTVGTGPTQDGMKLRR